MCCRSEHMIGAAEKKKAETREETIMGRRSHSKVVDGGLTEEVMFKTLEGSEDML